MQRISQRRCASVMQFLSISHTVVRNKRIGPCLSSNLAKAVDSRNNKPPTKRTKVDLMLDVGLLRTMKQTTNPSGVR